MTEEYIDSEQSEGSRVSEQKTHDDEPLTSLSFIPPELKEKSSVCEKCAIASVLFGGISLVSWVIMLVGITTSVAGIIFSIFGFRSPQKRHAKIGLILSVIGLSAVFIYAFAAANGWIHHSFFTTEIIAS